MTSAPQLLTDPFLQLPTETSVRVVWFTEFAGSKHTVNYGENLNQTARASTMKLSRAREDQRSHIGKQAGDGQVYQKPVWRDIWRHEAEVSGLTPGVRVNYQITSVREDGESISSDIFTLAANPKPGTPLKILLTSDHQLKPMTAANLQKVVETVGRVDAVWFAGDLVNISDRASEWFDDHRGGAFFPGLQGRANYEMNHNGVKTSYTGGKIIQHAPLFPCIGNHEVMGRFQRTATLDDEFNDTIPRAVAQRLYSGKSLKDNSFNTDTYEEIFTLPTSKTGGKRYYAVSFGDVRLVVLYATNMWRSPYLNGTYKGRYDEISQDLNNPENWGYGQLIYEQIAKGSQQYNWLEAELNSNEFKQAKYKVVMFHHPPHTLGDNIVPAYTEPVQIIERDNFGNIKAVRYEYPKDADYLIRDVMPLLESANVQFVLYGHSHLWNRFVSSSGMHFLETSNVGNSYGAAWGERKREVPSGYQEEYVVSGDPNGLEPIVPTIAPLLGEDGKPMPYIASNDITVFSIFDTATGTVSSYRFDTRKPDSEVIKFDEFTFKA
ncbi:MULTISPECIES: purple acid phosphatase family protein [unclassified Tolypothrix]|uniref:purple acid phosphatase family protein n=1 Tax=unclassified Tolypothrix TaxID=2649714 RepID=UPI0005EABC60|nr:MULTISPECIES: metallophosphoesterase family protein [unclassified Tolypothrix]BAY89553.1 metallophosphoesterase [Microchaete diplosiphon NIES-3275]EKF02527.1 putative metallophosphoesterase [Tolypothrix sp. PCC 7601]MBE9087631.1 metallophosphoesterase family protein [Tolypothrix sp. LEGE 11397]UYD23833.1 metallophosphoesterase family protein [Tolypothrix sp. PCC 7712]UYD33942.1 metallophosphoesterase family protein [Tolypothrix sp. PCC 7601]